MKLNIANATTFNIDEKLGISKARKDELFAFVEQRYDLVKQKSIMVRLVDHYAAIADFCNDLAEYTLCMHLFIFNLSRIGRNADSKEFTN